MIQARNLLQALLIALFLVSLAFAQDACDDNAKDYVPPSSGGITADGLLFTASTPATANYTFLSLELPSCPNTFSNEWILVNSNDTLCTNEWELPLTFESLADCVVSDNVNDTYEGDVVIEVVMTTNMSNPATGSWLLVNTTRKFSYPFQFVLQRMVEVVDVTSNSTIDVFASVADLGSTALLTRQEFVKNTRTARLTMLLLYNSKYRLTNPIISETTYGRNATIPTELINEDCASLAGTCATTYVINVALNDGECHFSGSYNLTLNTLLFPENVDVESPTTVIISVASEDICSVTTETATAQASLTSLKNENPSSSFALGDPVTWLFTVTSSRYISQLTVSEFWLCSVESGTTSSQNCFTLPVNDSSIVYILEPAYDVNLVSAQSQNLTSIPAFAQLTFPLSRELLLSRNPDALNDITTQRPLTYRASARLRVQYGNIFVPKSMSGFEDITADDDFFIGADGRVNRRPLATDSISAGASFVIVDSTTPSPSSSPSDKPSASSASALSASLSILLIAAVAVLL